MDLRNRNGKQVRRLGDSHSPVLDTYQLAKKEIFRIKTSDGYQLPASWLLPPGFDNTGLDRMSINMTKFQKPLVVTEDFFKFGINVGVWGKPVAVPPRFPELLNRPSPA